MLHVVLGYAERHVLAGKVCAEFKHIWWANNTKEKEEYKEEEKNKEERR